ncbi:MAG: CvpA family protein [Methylobacteriaceae bacterium]|nr:CvpA family protein [Methylobacteriaceae bacterium]MBV9633493.1 CvpA family protein [Methylobacteriaceae bacterium]
MPSYLDLGLIVIILISALLSMVRGFTREVLAILSWAAAAVAALYLHPLVLPYLKPYIQKDTIALAAAAAIVFFVTLVIVTIITVKISDVVLDSKIGALDRSLGFLFGAARGFLLAVVAFMFFVWLVPEKAQPVWVKNSRTKEYLKLAGDQLIAILPEDPVGAFKRLRGSKGTPSEEAPNETAPDEKPAPPAKI